MSTIEDRASAHWKRVYGSPATPPNIEGLIDFATSELAASDAAYKQSQLPPEAGPAVPEGMRAVGSWAEATPWTTLSKTWHMAIEDGELVGCPVSYDDHEDITWIALRSDEEMWDEARELIICSTYCGDDDVTLADYFARRRAFLDKTK